MLSFFYLHMTQMDITKERSLLNWAQIGGVIVFVAVTTWTASKIHSRFEIMEANDRTQLEQHEKDRKADRERIEYINERIDTKFDQLKDQYHSD